MKTTARHDGDQLARLRKEAGLSLDAVWFAAATTFPPELAPSRSTIARMEKRPEGDPVLLAFLCELYHVDFETTFPESKAALRAVSDLLIRASTWMDELAA
jgi:hypothetical protein